MAKKSSSESLKLLKAVLKDVKDSGQVRSGSRKSATPDGDTEILRVIRSNFNPNNFLEKLLADMFQGMLSKDRRGGVNSATQDAAIVKLLNTLNTGTFSTAELKLMRDHVRNRIFEQGFGNRANKYDSLDTKMTPEVSLATKKRHRYPAIAYTKYKYRYFTGELYESVKVTPVSGSLRMVIEFARKKQIVDSLVEKYGNFFKPTRSDVRLYQWIILKKLGLLAGQRVPMASGINPAGAAPAPSAATGHSITDRGTIRSYLKQSK